MRRDAVMITIILLFVLHPGTARAHKVSLFAYQEAGIVHTEAYFVDGTPCRNARVTARDAEDAVVAEGLTDDEGLFSFPYALTGDLSIAVRASMGHGSEILLTAVKANALDGSPEEGEVEGAVLEGASAAGGKVPPDEAIIERIVEDRIGPIRDSLREIQKNQGKPTLGRVIGGIGWIVGMAGAYLWGVSRKDRDKVKE